MNITILDDDVRELSAIGPQPEQLWVLLRMSEPNDEVQLGVQTAIVSIQDDDCKLNVCKTILCLESTEAIMSLASIPYFNPV